MIMETFNKLFDKISQEKGRQLYNDKLVEIQDRTDSMIKFMVYGKNPQKVSFIMKNGQPVSLRCNCPKSKLGKNCEHTAAAYLALYGDVIAKREKEKAIIAAQEKMAKEHAELEKKQKEELEEHKRKKLAKEETARKIAERNAQKAAKRAERKKKREEAELAEKLRREEEKRKQQEEAIKQQEELLKKEKEDAERKKKEEEERKAASEEAARKKQEKIEKAIERKEKGEPKKTAENSTVTDFKEKDDNVMEVRPQKMQPKSSVDYQYYDIDKLMDKLEISKENREKGMRMYKTGKVTLKQFQTGYRDDNDNLMVDIVGMFNEGKRNSYILRLIFTKDEVIRTECNCPECRKTGYFYWSSNKKCEYMAGLFYLAQQTIAEKNVGDATDRTGAVVLNLFRQQRSNGVVANAEKRQESIRLEPRITETIDSLEVSFKIGSSKLYVVKNLVELISAVENCDTLLYGKDTYINHQIDNFTQDSREWLKFITKAVDEEQLIDKRINGSRWGYDPMELKCSELKLYGWRMDSFYELIDDSGCEYNYWEKNGKKKKIIHTRQKNPRIKMLIDKNKDKDSNGFEGITVSCNLPHFYKGDETSYYIDGDYLTKLEPEFADRIKLLFAQAQNDKLSFKVGRKHLQDFYYNMLPQLEDVVQLEERNKQEIEEYLPPEVKFIFYLDNVRGNIICRVHAVYGDNEISILDLLNDREEVSSQGFRMLSREDEILYQVSKLFPHYDSRSDLLHCNNDEQEIFQVLDHGVEYLAELGEVQCTQSFKNMNVVQKVKVSVGVSLNNGTLDLDVMSEDFDMRDLLDILEGYRTKKKYFRLKSGDFVNLEDESLKMLAELVETLHLPPKEFIKGKMHLPVYRSLYMDKLLEENESVYSTRDKHFRSLVKNFKTVSESDFEEPQALSHIMRGYQKNGYKWLRLLESYGFGGILADDMGLGKTLQVISVLLSASEENNPDRPKTALVVAPASLVYNWKEEFEKYAPTLSVETITGTQQERQEKIADCDKNDVIVTSYDLLKRDIAYYEDKEFAYQIIDEAQYIKNHTTAAAKAIKVIKSRTRYALTGTPIENRLSELWSIFDYLMPGFLYGYDTFKKNFETRIVKNEDDDCAKSLQKMVAPFILRRLKSDVLKDLPDKLEEVRFVKIEGEQQKAYDAQVLHMKQTVATQSDDEFSKNKIQILAEITRLRQICCDPNLCFENYKGESAKLDSCIELVQSAIEGGHKILLFSQFTTMLEIIEKRLKSEGISFYKITGETSKEKRLQLVNDFNEDDTSVFLISLKAGGVGLNLTGADVVIHYDPWWNVAAQNQATDRAHRIGQKKKVIVYKLIVKKSVEEKILKLQEAKKDLADKVINGDANQLGSMSKEELLEILEA